MKNDLIKLLQRKKKNILEQWIKNQLEDDSLRDDLMTNDDVRIQSEEVVNSFIDALNEKSINDPRSAEFNNSVDILSSIAIGRAKQGYSPRETGIYIFNLKEAIFSVIQQEGKESLEMFDQVIKIGKILDSFSISTFETFIKGREEVILRQTDEISEISTPVIRVWDGVLALPIIGTLDSSRTQVVMENLLQEIVETGSSIAILDISGVPAVDSLVAQHLIKTVSATRLMGAECIISGIRPEIAQTVVHLGIDLSNIITKSTLSSALRTAFDMLRYDVVKKKDRIFSQNS